MTLCNLQLKLKLKYKEMFNYNIYTNIICLYLIGVHDTKIILIKTMMTIITLLVQCSIIQFRTTVDSNNHHDDPLNFRLV